MDGEQLVDLLIQNEIGITLTPLQLIQLYSPDAVQCNTSMNPKMQRGRSSLSGSQEANYPGSHFS
jgi:hypothetical protein